MNAQEGRPSSHEVGARQSTRTTPHIITARAFAHESTPRHRRWTRKPSPRVTLSGAAAWALFTLVVGTALIAVCVVLTLGWPR